MPNGAARSPGEADQPLIRLGKVGERQRRLGAGLAIEKGVAGEGHQVAVADFALHQKHNPVGLGAVAVAVGQALSPLAVAVFGECDLDPDDRLDAGFGAGRGEFERTEQIAAVGDRDGRHRLGPA